MTTTSTATLNGKPPRKQLGDQLDRLDTIIDALADGLPGAVADACKEGARLAVKDAVIEILTNPELRRLIAGIAPAAPVTSNASQPSAIPPEPTPPKTGFWSRAKAKMQSAKDAIVGGCRAAKEGIVTRCRAAKESLISTIGALSVLVPLRRILVVGVGLGAIIGAISYVCPHGLSAFVSGVAGACAVITAQVVAGFVRLSRMFGFGTD
jgi:hypothetical protein